MDFEIEQLAGALDTISFLARSPGRVRVLETLAEGDGPYDRAALQEATGVPRTTVGRIVTSLHERDLVIEQGRACRITPLGEMIMTEFDSLLRTAVTVERLRPVIRWLPVEELDFDLEHFADATIITPESGDAFGHLRRLEELFFGADRARLLSPTVAMGSLEDYQETYQEFLDSDKQAESIVSVDTLAQVQADEMSAQMFRPAFETGRVKMFLYDGTIPFLLAVTDGTALLAPTDEHDIPVALVETRNEAIRSWVEATYDEYRAQSTQVTVDDLPL